MIKALLDKKKRESLKENVEVIFAVFTIISFISTRIKNRKEEEEGETKPCPNAS